MRACTSRSGHIGKTVDGFEKHVMSQNGGKIDSETTNASKVIPIRRQNRIPVTSGRDESASDDISKIRQSPHDFETQN